MNFDSIMKNRPERNICIGLSQIQIDKMPNGQFHAMFTWPPHPYIGGCPLGRGDSEASAQSDLIARTESESQVSIQLIVA